MKPKRQERPKAYYEARELIAELYGMSQDPEPESPAVPLPFGLSAAVDVQEDY
jgi:hypothetical protein